MIPNIHINETSPVIALLHKMMQLLNLTVDKAEQKEQRAGEQTQNAIRDFQKQNQLPIDDKFVADKSTIDFMLQRLDEMGYLKNRYQVSGQVLNADGQGQEEVPLAAFHLSPDAVNEYNTLENGEEFKGMLEHTDFLGLTESKQKGTYTLIIYDWMFESGQQPDVVVVALNRKEDGGTGDTIIGWSNLLMDVEPNIEHVDITLLNEEEKEEDPVVETIYGQSFGETQKLLSLGMQNDDVMKAKLRLALLGFSLYKGEPDFSVALRKEKISLTYFDKHMEGAVKAFQKKFELRLTGAIYDITASRMEAEVNKTDLFAVAGFVVATSENPENTEAIAYDKDLRSEEPLGKATPNKEGAYAILYNRQNFLRAEKERADLVVKVNDAASNQLAASETKFQADHIEIVNFTLEDKQSQNHTECERYSLELETLLENLALRELTREDIYFLHKETGISMLHLQFMQLDDTYRQSFKIANCVFYGLFRQDLPTNLKQLKNSSPSELREAFKKSIGENIVSEKLLDDLEQLIEAFQNSKLPNKNEVLALQNIAKLTPEEIKKEHPQLYTGLVQLAVADIQEKLEAAFKDSSDTLRYYIGTMDLSELKGSESLKEYLRHQLQQDNKGQNTVSEGFSKIKSWDSPETLDAILLPNIPISQNPLFQKALQQASVFKISELAALSDSVAQQLAVRNLSAYNIGPETVEGLVKDNVITQAEGETLKLNANVYALANGNVAFANAIKNQNPNTQINSIANLASLETEDWLQILTNAKVEGDEEAIEEQAKIKQKQIEILYPHRVFKTKTLASEAPDVRNLMERFYNENEALNFLYLNYDIDSEDRQKIKLDNVSESDQQTIFSNLKTNQRIYSLTKDAGDTALLKIAGYGSSVQIASGSVEDLIETSGLDPELAKKYYAAATEKNLKNGLAFGTLIGAQTDPWAGTMIGGVSSAAQSYLRRLNGYEDFFGKTDFCKCEHCKSIIGPATYFVDLMDFLKEKVLNKHFNTTALSNSILNPKIRRPDLWTGLQLNCKNTNELIPYLIIINEVLENFIYTQHPDTEEGTLPDRKTIENFVYGLLSLDAASLQVNSFSQPFHLPLTELEIYLQHFPITRASIAKIVLAYKDDTQNILPQAALNLSQREYDLILTSRSENEPLNRAFLLGLYGFGIFTDGRVPRLNVQLVMKRMDINRVEFTKLIKTYFVTANSTESPSVVGAVESEGLQINVEYLEDATMGNLDRMHRFIRLWRQLDWSISELDRVIKCLHQLHEGDEAISNNLLPRQVVQLKEIQKNLKISVNELVSLFCDIPDELFDKRFNLDAFIHEDTDRWIISDTPTDWAIFQHPGYSDTAVIAVGTETTNLLHRLLAGLGLNDEELFLLIEQLRILLGVTTEGSLALNLTSLSVLYRHAMMAKKFKLTVKELFFLIQIAPEIPANYISGISELQELIDLINWQKKSKYSLAELAFILPEPLEEQSLFESPVEMAYDIWEQVQLDQSLLFADTLFALSEGITEAQSKAIVAANDSVIVKADLKKIKVAPFRDSDTTFNLNLPETIKERLSEEQLATIISKFLKIIAEHLLPDAAPIPGTIFENIGGLTGAESLQINNENTPDIFEATSSPEEFQLNPSVRTDPSLIGLTIPTAIWGDLTPEEQHTLYFNFIRLLQPEAPETTDRLFVGITRLTLEQSQEILGANPNLFVAVESEPLYWLSPDFDPKTLIHIPVDIPLPEWKAQEMLLTKHVGEVMPNLLSGQLGISSEKVKALGLLGGSDFNQASLSALLTNIAQGRESLTELEQMIAALQKLAVWFKDRLFDSETLSFVREHSGGTSQLFKINTPGDYRSPVLLHIQQTETYRQLRKNLKDAPEELHRVLSSYEYGETPPNFAETSLERESLTVVLDAKESLIQTINNLRLHGAEGVFPATDSDGNASNEGLKALHKFKELTHLVQYLGIGGEVLPLFISNDFDKLAAAVQAVVAAIRTKYDTEEEWQEKIDPFEDKIREKKRDALTDYLIHTFRSTLTTDRNWFKTTLDLYNYFLIDTELEGCARTSRVVAGISSLQLYIQRCLMSLEQNEDGTIHVLPENIPAGEWEWRKNYRVWEANRKVFLYPENYIEPDLRDNKTELFTELESTLLQQEISAQNSMDAYSKYMKGFDEIANLKIAGSYHHLGNLSDATIDKAADTLHLFGVTSSEPPIYYYRTIKNIYKHEKNSNKFGVLYNPWKKINLQIPVKKVSPIVYQSRLYVFWVEIVTRPKNDMVDGTNQFAGYEHKMSVKFSSQQLDGTWQAPQQLKLNDPIFERGEGVIWDPLVEYSELNYWLAYNLTWLRILGNLVDPQKLKERLLIDIKKKIKNNYELLNENQIQIEIELSGIKLEPNVNIYPSSNFRNLLKPKHEQPGYDLNQLHLEPKDDYTLKGYNWERIYPTSIWGNSLTLANSAVSESNSVNLFQQTLLGSGGSRGIRALHNRFHLNGSDLKFLNGLMLPSYFDSEKILRVEELPASTSTLIVQIYEVGVIIEGLSGDNISVSPINGTLNNAIIEVDRDLFLIYQHSNKAVSNYTLKRLGSTLNEDMAETLFNKGLSGLLDIGYQKILSEKNIPFTFLPDGSWNEAKKAIDKGIPDFEGSLGTYFREIFFHTPFLIANHLNSQNKFADAQRWYHYIFNPTASLLQAEKDELTTITDPLERKKFMAKRVWQFIEFRNHTLKTWREQLNDQQAIEAYKNDPFNPHAIARLRLGAYMKCITMKYIDNLIDYGDHLFTQDTMESINEGTLLYIMALEILGPRPAELGDCEQDTNDQTYEQLRAAMNGYECYDFLNEIESSIDVVIRPDLGFDYGNAVELTPQQILGANSKAFEYAGTANANSYSNYNNSVDPIIDVSGYKPSSSETSASDALLDINIFTQPLFDFNLFSFHTSFLKQACKFCIPPNPDLLAYWNRVEDRLFKIRNCMNISGIRRQIALFAPEIDPRLLVRAKAAGLSLDDVLNSVQGDLPPYRFAFLLAKAKEYAGALQGFGVALLGALEKKSGEELAMLRLRQQDEVLKVYTTKLRDMEVTAAETGLEGLLRRKVTIENRKDYYQSLIQNGLSQWERESKSNKKAGHVLKQGSIVPMLFSNTLRFAPSVVGFSVSTPTDSTANAGDAFASFMQYSGNLLDIMSQMQSITAGENRREQGWKFSLQQSENELKEMEKQLVAAEIRRDISIKSRELHEKSIEQHQETYEFYRDKFTGLGLYTYLSSQLQRMYRESYQDAMTLARMAERAYRFERNDDTSVLLKGSYWNVERAGLLAGENLMNALRQLELRYIETNTRSMEIDQAFSLTQIDPAALLKLKTTGECEFTVPELYFDLFYPGQYRRRVQSARLTIPCITGPYSNVSAVMTLKNSYIRKDAKLNDEGGLTLVPPSRSTTVATSTAQNDSGVFRLDFRDERYMPFEGAGAVESTWQLQLPKKLRPFDYSSINDVILHISYTAEYDQLFREKVEGDKGDIGYLEELFASENFSLPRVFSLRQEFSQTYHRLLHSPEGEAVPLELSEKHFPLFLQGKSLDIANAKIIIELDKNGFINADGTYESPDIGDFELQFNGNPTGPWSLIPELDRLIESQDLASVLGSFLPAVEPILINLNISNAASLAPDETSPSDFSALDEHKIKDVYLMLEYRVKNI